MGQSWLNWYTWLGQINCQLLLAKCTMKLKWHINKLKRIKEWIHNNVEATIPQLEMINKSFITQKKNTQTLVDEMENRGWRKIIWIFNIQKKKKKLEGKKCKNKFLMFSLGPCLTSFENLIEMSNTFLK